MLSKKPNKNGARSPAEQPKGVYFLSLSLENVRCFGPKQTLDLSDRKGKPARWTILLGNNGTGKTTVLQALACAQFNSATIRALRTPMSQQVWATWAEGFRRSSGVLGDVIVTFSRGTGIKTDPKPMKFGLHVGREDDPDATGPSAYWPDHTGDLPTGDCFAYGASRRLGSSSEPVLDNSVASLFSDRIDLRNAEEWLLQLDYAAAKNNDAKARARFNLAKDLLLKIMPEGEVLDIRCDAGSGTHPKPKVEFQTPDGWVPLRQLGYGYQTLIAWMVDFASRMVERYPDSADPLKEPAVVLVDEIDLHLHPTWQRKLIGFLTARFPNTQFIATAHSPLVVQAASGANFAVLRRVDDHVEIDQRFQGIRNWSVSQVLSSDLFGLESLRPPELDALLARRLELLQQAKLSKADKAELKELEARIGELPAGETAKEAQEIRELTRKSQELLEKYHAQRQ